MDQTAPRDPAPRPYRSPRREAAALETRRRIRTAARELFLTHGYAGTSMRAVATAAQVAEKTVYLQFTTKSALLKEVVEVALVGDEAPVPAAGRDWFVEILQEPDAARAVRRLAEETTALHERTGALFAVARGAAASHPEVAALWEGGKRGHLADMTLLARALEEHGALPRALEVEAATHTLYVLLGPETWHLLRAELGLSAGAYREWLTTQLSRSLVVGC